MNIKKVPLGDTARIQSGFAFKSQEFRSTGVRLLRNINVAPGFVDWYDCSFVDVEDAIKYADFQLLEGDILLSLDRPVISTGIKVVQIKKSDTPSLLVQRVGRFLLDSSKIQSDYLYCFLQSEDFIRQVSGHAQSLGVPHISPRQIEAIQIPLPKLEEQRKIAAHLKSQLAAVEEARQAAQAQLGELTKLANAIVRGSLTQGGAIIYPLADVLDEVKRGVGATWADYPVLGATRDGVAPAKEPVGKNPERYKLVTTGTVFYNPMRILIGSIAMVDDGDAPGITSPDYVVLRGKAGIVDSRWFYYWLRSSYGVNCIASLARGAVRERMLFNRLADGEIELPPYAVQQAASLALAEIRPLKARIESQLREIELLPGRLLAQAFDSKGETDHD